MLVVQNSKLEDDFGRLVCVSGFTPTQALSREPARREHSQIPGLSRGRSTDSAHGDLNPKKSLKLSKSYIMLFKNRDVCYRKNNYCETKSNFCLALRSFTTDVRLKMSFRFLSFCPLENGNQMKMSAIFANRKTSPTPSRPSTSRKCPPGHWL